MAVDPTTKTNGPESAAAAAPPRRERPALTMDCTVAARPPAEAG